MNSLSVELTLLNLLCAFKIGYSVTKGINKKCFIVSYVYMIVIIKGEKG